jgi:hypothetical protein
VSPRRPEPANPAAAPADSTAQPIPDDSGWAVPDLPTPRVGPDSAPADQLIAWRPRFSQRPTDSGAWLSGAAVTSAAATGAGLPVAGPRPSAGPDMGAALRPGTAPGWEADPEPAPGTGAIDWDGPGTHAGPAGRKAGAVNRHAYPVNRPADPVGWPADQVGWDAEPVGWDAGAAEPETAWLPDAVPAIPTQRGLHRQPRRDTEGRTAVLGRGTGRHLTGGTTPPPGRGGRRPGRGGGRPDGRRVWLVALVVPLVVLLGYGLVVQLRSDHSRDDQSAPVTAPPPLAAPTAPPLVPPVAAAPPTAPAAPAAPVAPAPRRAPAPAQGRVAAGTPPSSMLVSSGGRSGTSEQLGLPGGGKIAVFDNMPMSGSSAATRAVVVIHGTGRNAEGYFQRTMAAAKTAGASDSTMIVAPWFQDEGKGGSGDSTWDNDAWKVGYAAENGGPSSFTAVDDVLASLSDRRRFPNLRHITLTGHSAGGQFTQRYAAFGKAPQLLPWVDVDYVVMNPSSYVYFDAARPGKNGGSFSVPSSSSCSDYNDYKYGLDGRQGYPGQLSAAAAVARYASRRVTILNGGADTFDNGDLDTSCGATLQGPNRDARGQYFFQHFMALHPGAPHRRMVVPGVDHDSEAMVGSVQARPLLFGK